MEIYQTNLYGEVTLSSPYLPNQSFANKIEAEQWVNIHLKVKATGSIRSLYYKILSDTTRKGLCKKTTWTLRSLLFNKINALGQLSFIDHAEIVQFISIYRAHLTNAATQEDIDLLQFYYTHFIEERLETYYEHAR